MEIVLFDFPLIMVFYGVALILCLVEIITHATGFWLPGASCIIFVACTTFALLFGVPMQEIGVITLLFLAINVTSLRDKGDKK